jgi:glycine dehydrogenase subunit 1
VIATYLRGVGDIEVVEASFGSDGRIEAERLATLLDSDTAALVVGQPNFFGVIEDLVALRAAATRCGALLVSATAESLALSVVQAPGDAGVDIAVAEGQSLGVPLSYGGPGIGLFATGTKFVRNMPGRLVGEARDAAGRRGYVLTLATREQHIRRERATSNICTNQGLIALAVTVYLALLGKHGLHRLGCLNLERAHRAREQICSGGSWQPSFSGPYFNEFAISGEKAAAAWRRARDAGVVAGVWLGEWYPELDDALLVAVTEQNSAADVDRLVEVLNP